MRRPIGQLWKNDNESPHPIALVATSRPTGAREGGGGGDAGKRTGGLKDRLARGTGILDSGYDAGGYVQGSDAAQTVTDGSSRGDGKDVRAAMVREIRGVRGEVGGTGGVEGSDGGGDLAMYRMWEPPLGGMSATNGWKSLTGSECQAQKSDGRSARQRREAQEQAQARGGDGGGRVKTERPMSAEAREVRWGESGGGRTTGQKGGGAGEMHNLGQEQQSVTNRLKSVPV